MATQIFLHVEDKPGSLAKVTQHLSDVGVNIDGIGSFSHEGKGFIWFVTNNANQTTTAMNNAGVKFTQEEVFLTKLPNTAGSLNTYINELANEGINLKSLYITMDGGQVFNTDNNVKAQEIAQKHGFLLTVTA